MPTVEADVAFGLCKLNLTPDEIRTRVAKALDAVGMYEYLKVCSCDMVSCVPNIQYRTALTFVLLFTLSRNQFTLLVVVRNKGSLLLVLWQRLAKFCYLMN